MKNQIDEGRMEEATMKMFHRLTATDPDKLSKPKRNAQARLSKPRTIKKSQEKIKRERLVAEKGRQKQPPIEREGSFCWEDLNFMLKTVGQERSSSPQQVELKNLTAKKGRKKPRAVKQEILYRPQKAKLQKSVLETAWGKPEKNEDGLPSPQKVVQGKLNIEMAREMTQMMTKQEILPSPPSDSESSISVVPARLNHKTIKLYRSLISLSNLQRLSRPQNIKQENVKVEMVRENPQLIKQDRSAIPPLVLPSNLQRLSRPQNIKQENAAVEMVRENPQLIKQDRSPIPLDLERSTAILARMNHRIKLEMSSSTKNSMTQKFAQRTIEIKGKERLTSPQKIKPEKLSVGTARENTQLIKQERSLNPLGDLVIKKATKMPQMAKLESFSSPQKLRMENFIPEMPREMPQIIKHVRFSSPQQNKMGKSIAQTDGERPQQIKQERLSSPQKANPDQLIGETAREKLQKIKQEWYSKPHKSKIVRFLETMFREKPIIAKHVGSSGYSKFKKEKLMIDKAREEHQNVNQKSIQNPQKNNTEKLIEEMDSEKPVRYTSQQLSNATDNYSQPLGSGSFGVVYKGKFANGLMVAVKVLRESADKKIEEQFMAELNSIGRTHHYNLVKLYGFCFEDKIRALVYEFMEKGSLGSLLFHQENTIEWEKLYDIAIGTAKGIAYLHEDCCKRIIHYDIKPENILLDGNFSPKVADFGLSRLYNRGNTHVTPTCFKGTLGYAAPELFMPFRVTFKCDVYSFGMVLFEILGRRRNSNWSNSKSIEDWFPVYVWKKFEERTEGGVSESLRIEEKYREKAERMITVALWCVQYRSELRPRMSNVVKMLEGEVRINEPTNPFPQLLDGLELHDLEDGYSLQEACISTASHSLPPLPTSGNL